MAQKPQPDPQPSVVDDIIDDLGEPVDLGGQGGHSRPSPKHLKPKKKDSDDDKGAKGDSKADGAKPDGPPVNTDKPSGAFDESQLGTPLGERAAAGTGSNGLAENDASDAALAQRSANQAGVDTAGVGQPLDQTSLMDGDEEGVDEDEDYDESDRLRGNEDDSYERGDGDSGDADGVDGSAEGEYEGAESAAGEAELGSEAAESGAMTAEGGAAAAEGAAAAAEAAEAAAASAEAAEATAAAAATSEVWVPLLVVALVIMLIVGGILLFVGVTGVAGNKSGSGSDAQAATNVGGLADISDINIEKASCTSGSAAGGCYKLPESKYWSLYGGSDHIGTKCLVEFVAATSKAWKQNHPSDTIFIGDLNDAGHLSHQQGVDVDIYTTTAANMTLPTYSKPASVSYAKLWFSTNNIEYIFFNDASVREDGNKYANQEHLPGVMNEWPNHEDHFHVRIQAPKSDGSCSREPKA